MTELPWIKLARAEIGVHEIKGTLDEPKVLGYFKDAGFAGIQDDETAWCAAFVGAMLKRSGITPSGSLSARSYEKWGQKLVSPLYGAIGVKKRTGGPDWAGHVGFIVGANSTRIYMLGGNQADEVSIASFNRSEFTAYRWPPVAMPKVAIILPSSLVAAQNVTEG